MYLINPPLSVYISESCLWVKEACKDSCFITHLQESDEESLIDSDSDDNDYNQPISSARSQWYVCTHYTKYDLLGELVVFVCVSLYCKLFS